MAKRPLSSDAVLPALKQPRVSSSDEIASRIISTFDTSLYDELVLYIFSYLSWTDLCTIQGTNHHWSRLTTDNQLWKQQFIQEYGRLRLRGSRGFLAKHETRDIKPLPVHAKNKERKSEEIDWKWMFRISRNWRKGRCTTEKIYDSKTADTQISPQQACVVIAGPILLTSTQTRTPAPPLHLRKNGTVVNTLFGLHRSDQPKHITAITVDQSPPLSSEKTMRAVVFYDSGEFAIFLIDLLSPGASRRLLSYFPHRKSERTSPIFQAAYHHPLLITLSDAFHLSLYNVNNDNVVHTQTLTSFTSFPPTSLVLSKTSQNYKLVLAYSIPVYPQHWSVAATELIINGVSQMNEESSKSCTVSTSRTTRACDIPQGWIDEAKLREAREQWGRKVARVADTQTDGKWVVLAPADALLSPDLSDDDEPVRRSESFGTSCTLQLYRLHLPSASSPSATPRLTFVRMLHGHVGPVVSLALADGRCVSLGVDGSLWVWDLEKGWSVEVQSARRANSDSDIDDDALFNCRASSIGRVTFDERRIVSADESGIELRRFDA